jgi:raffinose/stachyose/melibiose transport system permease protein
MSFNTLLFVGFMREFPKAIEEAAIIDGCNLMALIAKVVIPITKPVIATVLIFDLLYNWNEFPFAVTLLNKAYMFTISLGISFFKGEYTMDYAAMMAATVIILIPQLIIFGFFQRYIIEGMTAGAVKG